MLKVASDGSFSAFTAALPELSEFVPEIAPTLTDIVITKGQ
jgi:hypothetical protein